MPSAKVLQDLELYLERNRKSEERVVPIPMRKEWPHEGSVSGNRALIGMGGKKDFERVVNRQQRRRSIGRGEL
jgi:hypothetical protein